MVFLYCSYISKSNCCLKPTLVAFIIQNNLNLFQMLYVDPSLQNVTNKNNIVAT